jgi:PAS domain-containing protein
VPHLGRAARLRFRLERRARPPGWTLELLDALSWGIVLLNARQRPVLVNREAERILAQAHGLRLDRCGLYAQHPEDAQRLRRVLASAVAKRGDSACPGADVQVRRPSGARPLLLTVVPVGQRALDGIGAGSVRAVVHVFDPQAAPSQLPSVLAPSSGSRPRRPSWPRRWPPDGACTSTPRRRALPARPRAGA